MVKGISILLVVFVFFLLSFSERKIKNDLDEMKLKGRVKAIRESRECIVQKWCRESEVNFKFNEAGNMTEEIVNLDGKFAGKTIYNYDSRGNKIEKHQYSTPSDLLETGKKLYTYNEKGENIAITSYRGMQDLKKGTTVEFKYDKEGRKMESVGYKPDSSIAQRAIYKYYGDTLIEESTFYPDGKLSQTITSKYDSKGNEIEKRRLIIKSGVETIYISKYDSNCNVIGTGFLSKKGQLWQDSSEYKYDKTGNWIETRYFADDTLRFITRRVIDYF